MKLKTISSEKHPFLAPLVMVAVVLIFVSVIVSIGIALLYFLVTAKIHLSGMIPAFFAVFWSIAGISVLSKGKKNLRLAQSRGEKKTWYEETQILAGLLDLTIGIGYVFVFYYIDHLSNSIQNSVGIVGIVVFVIFISILIVLMIRSKRVGAKKAQ